MKIIFLSKFIPLKISLFAYPVSCAPCLFTFFIVLHDKNDLVDSTALSYKIEDHQDLSSS